MAKVYKVWIEIEEYDEERQTGETIDAPGAAVATFTTDSQAWRFAEVLQRIGETHDTRTMRNALVVPLRRARQIFLDWHVDETTSPRAAGRYADRLIRRLKGEADA